MSALPKLTDEYQYLSIEPYTPNIGALIHDFDLTKIDNETVRAELRRALVDYEVLFFRNQTLTPDQQIEVAKVFGDPAKAKAFFPKHAEFKEVEIIQTVPTQFRKGHGYGTDQWHADITFDKNPPTGTVLYAHITPPFGGDTLWASASAVYDSLPRDFAKYLETLEASHSFEHSGWPNYFYAQENGEELYKQARVAYLPVTHKVVQTHPVSGKKLVYVNPNFTDRIKGLSREQSDTLLGFIFTFFARPEVQARLHWEPNTVAIWDNRSTVHYATSDYGDEARLLHRVTFGEDKAF